MMIAPEVGSEFVPSDFELVDDLLMQARQDLSNVFVTKNIWERGTIVNNELQYYVEGGQNLEWVGDNLRLIGTRSDDIPGTTSSPVRYLSKLLSTRGRRSYRYGHFVMRAKFPPGGGIWPAFWMLPEFDQWPAEYANRILPEIDIMEYIGDAMNRYYGNVHFYEMDEYRRSELQYECGNCNMANEFHEYALTWTPDYLVWWFDGRVRKVVRTPAQMHQHYHVIVNLAIGGDWPGDPDPDVSEFRFDIQELQVFKSITQATVAPETTSTGANVDLLTRLKPIQERLQREILCLDTIDEKVRTTERELSQYITELQGYRS